MLAFTEDDPSFQILPAVICYQSKFILGTYFFIDLVILLPFESCYICPLVLSNLYNNHAIGNYLDLHVIVITYKQYGAYPDFKAYLSYEFNSSPNFELKYTASTMTGHA